MGLARKPTLTEVLVLVAAVGLWIGILAPRRRDPLASAKVTRCQMNLKAILMGVVTYEASNRGQMPLMRSRPATDAGVNASPMADTECDILYGEAREDGSIEDWSALGDNAMQNVWLMIGNQMLKEKVFECPSDVEYEVRESELRFGWTSPYQYSYSMHWPYEYAASDPERPKPNPAPFNAMLENVYIFADRSPGGPVSKDRPPSNHSGRWINVVDSCGTVVNHFSAENPNSLAGYRKDDIYTNALGSVGGVPGHEYDTSLNVSPR